MHGSRMKRELAKVKLHRNALDHECRFSEIFEGFDKVKAVRGIFGSKTGNVLSTLMVAAVKGDGYIWVDQYNKRLVLSTDYLAHAPKRDLYLDVIHELVHLRQLFAGKDLFDKRYRYIDRPTEIEAYSAAAHEAKRLGMSKKEIKSYIRVFWMSDDELDRLYTRVVSQRRLT